MEGGGGRGGEGGSRGEERWVALVREEEEEGEGV